MKSHIMIDIEALGGEPGGVVCSVGAVKFDLSSDKRVIPDTWKDYFSEPAEVPDEPIQYPFGGASDEECPSIYLNISIESSTRHGLTLDGATVTWWLGGSATSPDDYARRRLFVPPPRALHEALKELAAFIGCWPNSYIWAFPLVFDIALLRACYSKAGIPIPWRPQALRDLRTFRGNTVAKVPHYGPEHHALWDACRQATIVRRVHFIRQPAHRTVE